MNTMTEDTLVQQTTADYLQHSLHWDDSVYAMDETLGKEGTLGRDSEKERTRDAVKQRIYDYLYDDKTGLPVDSYEVDEIQGLTDVLFNHVYRAYPRVPSPIYGSGSEQY